MQRKFTHSAILATTFLATTALSANAGSLSIGTHMFADQDEIWGNYTYVGEDIVTNLNEVGSSAVVWGHEKLGLDQASRGARTLYLATAGLLNTRFHWANSLYFGHEFAHFQHAHRFGLKEHYFTDDATGEPISNLQAYLNIFLKGEVGGPATSGVISPGDFDAALFAEEGHEASFAGLNWQTNHSEIWIRDAITTDRKNAFDASDFFLNRYNTLAYTVGDYYRHKKQGLTNGDVYKFASKIGDPSDNETDTLKEIAIYSIAANVLSPVFLNSFAEFSEYTESGDTDLQINMIETPYGGFTWDIPQYLNSNSFALAPTIYLDTSPELASAVGASNLLLSAGYETAVVGDDPSEIRLTATGSWGKLDADIGLSAGEESQFYEATMTYNLTKNAALTASMAIQEGSTNRAKRNMPTGNNAYWTGLQLNF